MMISATGTTPICGYCGRPIMLHKPYQVQFGVYYHDECTNGPAKATAKVEHCGKLEFHPELLEAPTNDN
jgi:hypothetical protein